MKVSRACVLILRPGPRINSRICRPNFGTLRGNPGHRQGHDLTDHRASPRPYRRRFERVAAIDPASREREGVNSHAIDGVSGLIQGGP